MEQHKRISAEQRKKEKGKKVKCAICKKQCKGYIGLVTHLRYSHSIYRKDQKKYCDKYLKSKSEGKCLYCGEETQFDGITNYYKEFCKKHHRYFDLKWFIVKHGKREGKRRYKLKYSSQIRSLKAFQEEYGKKEGLKRYKKKYLNFVANRGNHKGTWTQKWFISKYGKKEGITKYKERSKRISYTQSVEYYIKKYGKTKGLVKYDKRRVFARTSFSKISQQLFWIIYKKLPQKLKKKTYFEELNYEFTNSHFYYDFVISNIKVCIEFNGDSFHANPTIYKANDHPLPFFKSKTTAKQIWEHDKKKLDVLKRMKYKILIVWASKYFYKKDREKTIKKCLDFIKKNTNDMA